MPDVPTRPLGHVPALTKGHGDTWMVYCYACSDAKGDWVYPCALGWQETPPQVLTRCPPTRPQTEDNR